MLICQCYFATVNVLLKKVTTYLLKVIRTGVGQSTAPRLFNSYPWTFTLSSAASQTHWTTRGAICSSLLRALLHAMLLSRPVIMPDE